MIYAIGEAAGQVWQYLRDHETSSLKRVGEGTGLKPKDLNRAVGWLAREEKIRIERCKNKELLSLNE